MAKKQKIVVAGVTHWAQPLGYLASAWERFKRGPTPPCPLCDERFVDGDVTLLLINNYKIFPNVSIHRDCAGPDGLDEDTVNQVHCSYVKAKKMYEEATKIWFRLH